MSFVGYYFLILFSLLTLSFIFWVLMQNNSKREVTYCWITTISLCLSIGWVLYGAYSIIKMII
jgi:hypothetical protein